MCVRDHRKVSILGDGSKRSVIMALNLNESAIIAYAGRMGDDQRSGKRSIEVGAWGRRTAANVADLRERRGMTQAMLAAEAERLGRPMAGSVVGKIEQGSRRVDADDLGAFAIALGVAPNRLLLTSTASADQVVEVSAGRWVSELDAWRWALGEKPLDEGTEAEFVTMNRPSGASESPLVGKIFEHPELVRAIARTADQARRLGVSLTELHFATAYAYLTQGGD